VLGLLALMALLAMPWLVFRLWTGWPTKAILRTPGNTWFLAFSPDSRTIATSNADGITLWDADTGRKRASWGEVRGYVGAFSPDGRTFAVALANYPGPTTIALIDVDTGRVKVSLPTRHTGLYDLAFTEAGRSLRALLGDVPNLKETVTWDATTGQQTSSRLLTCPTASCDTAVSLDGRLLALAPFSGAAVRIWDLEADRELARLTNRSTVVSLARGLAFSGDGRTLAVSRENGSFEIWDVPTRRLKMALRGHTGDYVSIGIRLAPDGRTLASRGEYLRPSSLPGGLRLASSQALFGRAWRPAPEVIVVDIGTGRRLARAAAAVHPFYSPDSATIATYESDLSIRLRPSPARPR
jgi:WD40 repeat protein